MTGKYVLYSAVYFLISSFAVNIVPVSGSTRSKLNILDIHLSPAFPAVYSYYDENPLCAVSVQSLESRSISNVHIGLYAKQFMDSPKLCASITEASKNEEIRVPLFAIFLEKILIIIEGTRAAACVMIYARLEQVDGKLMQKYAYLISHLNITEKASSAVLGDTPVWEEELYEQE